MEREEGYYFSSTSEGDVVQLLYSGNMRHLEGCKRAKEGKGGGGVKRAVNFFCFLDQHFSLAGVSAGEWTQL